MSVLSGLLAKVKPVASGVARLPRTIVSRQIRNVASEIRSLPGQLKDLAVHNTLGPLPALISGLISEGASSRSDEPHRTFVDNTEQRAKADDEGIDVLEKIYGVVTKHTGILEAATETAWRGLKLANDQKNILSSIGSTLQRSAETARESANRAAARSADDMLTGQHPANEPGRPSALGQMPALPTAQKGFLENVGELIQNIGGAIIGGLAAVFGVSVIGGGVAALLKTVILGAIKKIPIITLVTSIFGGIIEGWKEYSRTGDLVQAVVTTLKETAATFLSILTFGAAGREEVEQALTKLNEWFTNLGSWAMKWVDMMAKIQIPSFDILGYRVGPIRPFAPIVGELPVTIRRQTDQEALQDDLSELEQQRQQLLDRQSQPVRPRGGRGGIQSEEEIRQRDAAQLARVEQEIAGVRQQLNNIEPQGTTVAQPIVEQPTRVPRVGRGAAAVNRQAVETRPSISPRSPARGGDRPIIINNVNNNSTAPSQPPSGGGVGRGGVPRTRSMRRSDAASGYELDVGLATQ